MKRIFCIIAVALLCACSDKKIAGVIDETDTGIVGKVHFANRTGAPKVAVKVFLDTSVTPIDGTVTDDNGAFGFARLSPGSYSIWAQSSDSLGAFADSIQIFHAKKDTTDLTLEKCGSIVGFVGLQPQHDLKSVTVQALGTQKYSNVDDDGEFNLKGLAPGEYTLRFMSIENGYTPTYVSVTVSSGVVDTLDSVIVLIYAGIPVVTHPKTSYDTLNGIVRLMWDSTGYKNFRDFLIYRDPSNALQPSTSQVAATKDNSFSDTLSIEGAYTYRIAIRSNDLTIGPTYYEATVTVYSAQQIYSIFNTDSLHAPLNMPCTLRVNISSWFGSNPTLTWNVGPKASVVDSSAQTPIIMLHDTLTPDYPCILTVKGQAGKTASDTLYLQSWLAWEKIAEPLISDGKDFKSIVYNGSIFVFICEKRQDTIDQFLSHDKWHEWSGSDGKIWQKVSDSLPFSIGLSKPMALKGKILMADNQAKIWESTDGKTWNAIKTWDPDTIMQSCFFGDTQTVWSMQQKGIVFFEIDTCYSSFDGKDWVGVANPLNGYTFPCGTSEITKINGTYCLLGDLAGKLFYTGSSFLSIHPKTIISTNFPDISNSFPLFIAIEFLNSLFLVGIHGNEIWYSPDLGDTWGICGDDYPKETLQSTSGSFRPHTCFVLNQHLYSISNKGVRKTK